MTQAPSFALPSFQARGDRGSFFVLDKSQLTTFISLCVVLASFFLEGMAATIMRSVGLFAVSGAVTNWLAIHMLFERVPLLYGSGVVQARFAEIRTEIRRLVLEEFFEPERVREVVDAASASTATSIDLSGVAERFDTTPAWESLVEIVMSSRLGSALGMLGGQAALDPLREPFEDRVRQIINEVAGSDAVRQAVAGSGVSDDAAGEVYTHIVEIVDRRIEELSPGRVKQIVKRMINDYLGWLVVWGGAFGGAMGLAAGALGAI